MAGLTRKEWGTWWAVTLGIPLGVYALQLALLCVRFGQLPNYYAFYDWPENIIRIIRSTPSLSDIVRIGSDEWLFEVGRKSVFYGLTVSEWRLALEPAKVLLLALASAVAATNGLLVRRGRACPAAPSAPARRAAETLTVSGTAIASLTSVTISWVACCGVPSWVTGLTILGLSYSSALVLQPFGGVLVMGGFGMLLGGAVLLIRYGGYWRKPLLRTSAAAIGATSSGKDAQDIPQRAHTACHVVTPRTPSASKV